MKNVKLSRRKFLKHSGHGVAATTLLSSVVQLGAMTSAGAQEAGNDYKAMVCILLAGGADTYHMLVPTDNAGYQQYAGVRGNLALPQQQLLGLNSAENSGKTLGLHPAFTGLQNLYNQGQVAFLSNVGTLVEPTSPSAFANGSVRLPDGLQSHSDQISQWQTSLPDTRSATGWGGRMADLLRQLNSNQNISMNISLSGNNLFQSGRSVSDYSIVPNGSGTVDLFTAGQDDAISQLANTAVDSMYANNYRSIFRRAYAASFNNAISTNEQFSQALRAQPALTTAFGADEFSRSLQMVARTIAAQRSLGMRRQTFFINLGGWDHHEGMLTETARMFPILDAGLTSFQNTMAELGMTRNVTTFTTSDFARTLTSNGRGSDHGWGGNHLIMGGAVSGGQIYGQYPDLSLNNPLDTGRGVLIPTTSVDNYFAELALWFGVSPGQLADVLPNIGRFYNTSGSAAPVGFMAT